jgi:hypothetical protein
VKLLEMNRKLPNEKRFWFAFVCQNTSTVAPNVIVNGWKTDNNKGRVVAQWIPMPRRTTLK